MNSIDFKNKKVLVFGLGLLGGGVATTNWLLKQGAKITVTDLKTVDQLKSSLEKIKGHIELKLGGHSEDDIRSNDLIVLNQDVSIKNQFVQLAFQLGKQVETEGTLFFKLFPKRIVGVTGTRGKTTTVSWINTFLQQVYRSSTAGNYGDVNPFLEIIDKGDDLDIAVAEIPSFQLEFFHLIDRSPEVAVITNLSPDHLNRHGSMEDYALAKANIFRYQTSDQHVVLNHDNQWTEFFLKRNSRGHAWQFSIKSLSPNIDGVFYIDSQIFLQKNGKAEKVLDIGDFIKEKGEHNLENLLASSLAAHLADVSWAKIQAKIKSLPEVPFRQEVIYQDDKLTVINDTTATSPEGGIAALRRFASPVRSHEAKAGRPEVILIAGGTDRELDFVQWAQIVQKSIKPENVIFLSGSATNKMLEILSRKSKVESLKVFNTLEDCLKTALALAGKYGHSVVLFSPASKSFEKFKNEYDRGEQFNLLVKKLLR